MTAGEFSVLLLAGIGSAAVIAVLPAFSIWLALRTLGCGQPSRGSSPISFAQVARRLNAILFRNPDAASPQSNGIFTCAPGNESEHVKLGRILAHNGEDCARAIRSDLDALLGDIEAAEPRAKSHSSSDAASHFVEDAPTVVRK